MTQVDQIVNLTRPFIVKGDLVSLQAYYYEVIRENRHIDVSSLFCRLFINSCIYKQIDIAKWLYELYKEASLTMKLGVRPTFYYCKSLASKNVRSKRDEELVQWLDMIKKETPSV